MRQLDTLRPEGAAVTRHAERIEDSCSRVLCRRCGLYRRGQRAQAECIVILVCLQGRLAGRCRDPEKPDESLECIQQRIAGEPRKPDAMQVGWMKTLAYLEAEAGVAGRFHRGVPQARHRRERVAGIRVLHTHRVEPDLAQ